MKIWYIWFLAAFALIIFEMFVPADFFLATFAPGCFVVAIITAIASGFPIQWQFTIWAVVSFLVFLFIRPLVKRLLSKKEGEDLKSGVHAFVGLSGIVTQAIDPVTGTGRVKVRNEDWKAAPDDMTSQFEEGARIVVTRVEGVTMYVKQSEAAGVSQV